MNHPSFNSDKYVNWLSSADPWQREEALEVVWHAGIEGCEEQICAILRTDNVITIRRLAIKMLKEKNNPAFRENFVEALGDEDWCVRGWAILALKEVDDNWQEIPEVAALLAEATHDFVRYCADIM